jgi:DNA topoisomerase-1
MIVRRSRRGPFLGCSRYPDCTNIKPLPGEEGKEAPPKEPAPWTSIPCEKCGKPMAIRSGKRGQFLGCSAFPRCRSIKKMPEEGTYEIVPRPEPQPKEKKAPSRRATKKTEAK